MIHVQERITEKLPGITSLFVSFDYNKAIVDELRLMQNCSYNEKTKEWEIPLTNLTELLDRCCKLDRLHVSLAQDHWCNPNSTAVRTVLLRGVFPNLIVC